MSRPAPRSYALGDVFARLEGAEIHGEASISVTGISLDSRTVQPGDLYAALPGFVTHGAQFVRQAVDAGAVAVITDPTGWEHVRLLEVPCIVVSDPRRQLGEISAFIYGHSVDRLTSIGITGTNGKTTVAYMVEAGLRAAGRRTGIIGTLGTRIGDEDVPSVRTTPEATELHAIFAVMEEAGVDTVVMEVSSHALALGRVDGITFDIGVFTNLSQDHLDFHGSMEEYFQAKATLFTPNRSRASVVCVDDVWGQRLAHGATTFSMSGVGANWQGRVLTEAADGEQKIEIRGPDGSLRVISIPLGGRFNAANAVAAYITLTMLGLSDPEIIRGLARVRVPGRMEAIDVGLGFTVVIDYAHSPAAIENVLTAVRRYTPGRVITVVGAGGDRDRAKRPLMGEAAAQLSDLVIVTDDNPRSEDPASIRSSIISGISEPLGKVRDIADRHDAIVAAVAEAVAGDSVVVLGKGHEKGQEVLGVVSPFSDYDVARDALMARLAP